MTRFRRAGGALAALLLLAALVAGVRACARTEAPRDASRASPALASTTSPPPLSGAPVPAPGFLYGRVTTEDGTVYEGRLRWGEEGDQEAFWNDTFNGVERDNAWAALVAPERLPVERRQVDFFGLEIGESVRPVDLSRQFLARFGDLVRIEAEGREVRATTKSGTVARLDRYESSDFDDGVRVWDASRGVVDLASGELRAIDFLPTPPLAGAPDRLHGTVRTRGGTELRGFLLWSRRACLGEDELVGSSAGERHRLRFGEIRSIARETDSSARVTLADGRELVLGESRELGAESRGIVVDDPRFGWVVVSWGAFDRVDFDAPGSAGSGPGYGEIAPGRPLSGRVALRDGRSLAGRLVLDLDESETTEMLDATRGDLRYSIPLGLVATIAPRAVEEEGPARVKVTLGSGERLALEADGDLGPSNAGLLVFVEGSEQPVYAAWDEVERIELDPSSGGS